MKRNIFLIIWISIFLHSCSFNTTLQKEENQQEPINTEKQQPVTETSISTETLASEIPENLHTQTPIIKPTTPINLDYSPYTKKDLQVNRSIPLCIEGVTFQNADASFGISGSIILQNDNATGLNMATGTPVNLSELLIPHDGPIHVFGVSPNGKWLAYSPIIQRHDNELINKNLNIVLLGSDGSLIEKTPDLNWLKEIQKPDYKIEQFVWGYWLNDHSIFTFVNSIMPEDYRPQIGYFYPVILNPFEGNLRLEEMKLIPDIDGLDWFSYSPDMKNVLYAGKGISLLERKNSSLDQLWVEDYWIFQPGLTSVQWSPDSSWVVFTSQDLATKHNIQVNLVSRNKKEIQEIRDSKFGYLIKYFYWSPNSRYFAFISSQANDKDTLFIFDVSQNKFILECTLENKDLSLPTLPSIIWSPDNKWIAISQRGTPLRLLRISDRKGVVLDIYGEAVGWSDQFMPSNTN